MISHGKDIKIFTGNANPKLAADICKIIGTKLGESEVKSFADGEASVSLYETVRGSDVFLIQSTCKPVNDNLMELLIMVDACRRAPPAASPPSCPTSAMPVRTARPRAATPSPPSSWPTCSSPRALTAC